VKNPKLTAAQEFMRNKEADVILFVDVLLDEEATAFFLMMITDRREIYGQVHKRLLNAALALGVDQDQAEKSKATAYLFLMTLALRWGAHSTNCAAP
jgi:hypothetical protein